MKNLIPYEAINEAATALPAMPAFLKTAGAKPQHVKLGGPWTKDQTPNAWAIDGIPHPQNPKDTWEIFFFPNGTFHTSATGAEGLAFLKSGGKWKANSTGTFTMGRKTIKGVDMTFTSFLVLNPPT
jgi:glucose/arabinose dehydrogenase